MKLEDIVKNVMLEHELRLDRCEVIPLKRRPHEPRARPNTALIAEAAKAKTSKRMARWLPTENHCRIVAMSNRIRYSVQANEVRP